MGFSDSELLARVPAGDIRATARLISLLENGVPRARSVQAALFSRTGKAKVIGITGSPGAGKSTLVDQLAYQLLTKGARVAILAVDPSSPFSGGAVLGDRIRMVHASENATAFIRSMATRGALGGLSRATYDAVQVLDAAGFEYILIETVGVGQAEIDIVRMADTTIVVLVPGMGDSVQAFKAGVLEIADLFVINKADREGVDLLQRDLRLLLSLAEYSAGEWEPPILRTVATSGEGVEKVIEDIQRHVEWLERSGKRREKRINLLRQAIIGQVRDHLQSEILTKHGERLTALATECYEQKRDPYTTALGLIK